MLQTAPRGLSWSHDLGPRLCHSPPVAPKSTETGLVPPAKGAEGKPVAVTATVFTIQNSKHPERHEVENSSSTTPEQSSDPTTLNMFACQKISLYVCILSLLTYF